jgi:hypothetical protein
MVNSSTTRAFFSSSARVENQSGPSGFRIRPFFLHWLHLGSCRAVPDRRCRTVPPIGTFSEQICKNRKKGVDILLPACYTSKCSAAEHTAWGYSSAGRALDWQSRGQRFDPAYLHQNDTTFRRVVFLFPVGIRVLPCCFTKDIIYKIEKPVKGTSPSPTAKALYAMISAGLWELRY